MVNPIKEIYRFNKEAGLLEKDYNDFLESSFQIEEALEGHKNLDSLGYALSLDGYSHTGKDNFTPKELSRNIVRLAYYDVPGSETKPNPLADVDRLDKACDSVVYAIGSIAKLGLTPQQITQALNVVMRKNFEKLNCPKDEHGKLMKPEGFIGPEAELQKILDQREIRK